MLTNIMPILSRQRSAGISHNIARERQEESVGGGQINTCAPVERAGESVERRSGTMSGGQAPRDDSRVLSDAHLLWRGDDQ